VTRFLNFLKGNGINIDKVKSIYAEEEIKLKNKTEIEFLKYIKNNKKLQNHSFASFYNDGNVRIFNRNEIIFDLIDELSKTMDDQKEIVFLSEFFLKQYKNSYKKSGIIHSNKSMFIFSNNKFACLSHTSCWVKDAIRVGIDPMDIDILYLTNGITPDSLGLNVILSKYKRNSKIKIIIKGKNPSWTYLLPDDVFSPIYIDANSIKINVGNIKVLFKNNRIGIFYKNYKLVLKTNKTFLNNGEIIKGEYLFNKTKKTFQFIIEDFQKDFITLFTCNPLIFEEHFKKDNFIKSFWEVLSDDITKNISCEIYSTDLEYKKDYLPPFKDSDDFYSKLFTETIRRINIEGNLDIEEPIFIHYKEILENFSGKEINKNGILIEQLIGFDNKLKRVVIRDFLAKNDFFNMDDSVNPFCIFQKELDNKEWDERHKKYRENYKKNLRDDVIVNKIDKRFLDVAKEKRFYIEEQDRLKRFITKIEAQEKEEKDVEELEIPPTKTVISETDKKDFDDKQYILNDEKQKK
ncbi:MAG: hypothetical protein KAT05_02540, partial [Spirochaetes bacterium]|nr:hypothetical protein [Spirochaetota bacterium]